MWLLYPTVLTTPNNTNKADNTAYEVSTAHTQATLAVERFVNFSDKSGLLLASVEQLMKGNPQQKEYKEKAVIDSGKIYRKGKIKTGSLDFDDVYFCKDLKYNLFSMSQICDKKNNVLFTDTECLVLSSDFKLLDEGQVLLRVPRKDNIYSVDLKSVVPTGGLTCLIV
ncbi:hypothetical protein Tco_0624742 [Tanacetum coccineum]|uniref:Uncharacterized protein n=1 Tax=Tanacetum coccineum TaxID=301880 RepID=A0ABQ4WEV2_9ASTR